MAGVFFNATSGEVSFTAATAKTAIQIKAAANQRCVIRGIKIMGKASAGGTDQPAKVRVTRSTANFGTGSSGTSNKNNPSDSETLQTSVFSNFTVEPTTPTDGAIYWEVQPQLGIDEFLPPQFPIIVPGGQSVQFEITCPANQTMVVTLQCEE